MLDVTALTATETDWWSAAWQSLFIVGTIFAHPGHPPTYMAEKITRLTTSWPMELGESTARCHSEEGSRCWQWSQPYHCNSKSETRGAKKGRRNLRWRTSVTQKQSVPSENGLQNLAKDEERTQTEPAGIDIMWRQVKSVYAQTSEVCLRARLKKRRVDVGEILTSHWN